MANSGLSANEIADALISMMARSKRSKAKAGYIDARPPEGSHKNFLRRVEKAIRDFDGYLRIQYAQAPAPLSPPRTGAWKPGAPYNVPVHGHVSGNGENGLGSGRATNCKSTFPMWLRKFAHFEKYERAFARA